MKRQILNLEGVAVLTKEQQKAVNGGFNKDCVMKLTSSSGNQAPLQQLRFSSANSGAEVSAAANSWCVEFVMLNPGGKCGYDCAWDGLGQ